MVIGGKMKDKIRIKIEDQEFEANKRNFSTGKQGYGLYDKILIGEEKYQLSINIIKISTK